LAAVDYFKGFEDPSQVLRLPTVAQDERKRYCLRIRHNVKVLPHRAQQRFKPIVFPQLL
jgi:hypothetical protein